VEGWGELLRELTLDPAWLGAGPTCSRSGPRAHRAWAGIPQEPLLVLGPLLFGLQRRVRAQGEGLGPGYGVGTPLGHWRVHRGCTGGGGCGQC